jgi:hypothetical protein
MSHFENFIFHDHIIQMGMIKTSAFWQWSALTDHSTIYMCSGIIREAILSSALLSRTNFEYHDYFPWIPWNLHIQK